MADDTPKVYTVSELTSEIQKALESNFDFVWVEGEISDFSAPASGHYYMLLKDENSRIRAVMFRMQTRYLKFRPENGMRVIAQGRIGIYAPRGEYQLVLDYLEPTGVGALALAFEQLKKKLSAGGLFDEALKRPLPFLPQRVAVITSPTGAAIRDFLKIIGRRFANIDVTVVPVRVQGADAAADIVQALDLVNRTLETDVIVVTRGGGSLEDLWAFNQEEVALAIRRSKIPVVSAVGHEIDLTISDLAADLRAPTPSAAAEILVEEKESLSKRLLELRSRSFSAATRSIARNRQAADALKNRLRDPRKRFADLWMRLDELHSRLWGQTNRIILAGRKRLELEVRALALHSPKHLIDQLSQQLSFKQAALQGGMSKLLVDQRSRLQIFDKGLQDLSPLSVLRRGYSLTWKLPEGLLLRDASMVDEGDRVRVRLEAGELLCEVERVTRKAGPKPS
jgi:exodeoxyribonuclease VII large subunit